MSQVPNARQALAPLARSVRSRLWATAALRPPRAAIDDAVIELLTDTSKNRRYDLQTSAIITRVMGPTSLGIDIGAHVGDILRRMVDVAPDVRHLAFEPLPHLAAGLRQHFPSVDVHQVALVANPRGAVEFHHVASNPGYSGLRERRYDRPDETIEKITVDTARLDDIVDSKSAPELIKLDVEGAELGVLEGATSTIGRARPVIVFEHGLGASDRYGTTPEAVHDFFAAHDMDVSLPATWLEHGPPLSREQLGDQFHRGANFYFVASPS